MEKYITSPIELTDFDYLYYLKLYPDLRKENITTLEKSYTHWHNHGCYEGRIIRSIKSGKTFNIKLEKEQKIIFKKNIKVENPIRIEKPIRANVNVDANVLINIREDKTKEVNKPREKIKSNIKMQSKKSYYYPDSSIIPLNKKLNVKYEDISVKKLSSPFAILVHIFDTTMQLQYFIKNINNLTSNYTPDSIDTYINIVLEDNPYFNGIKHDNIERERVFKESIEEQAKSLTNKNYKIFYNENRGGDIGGLMLMIKEIMISEREYSHFLFAHSKTKIKWRSDLCSVIFNYPLDKLSNDDKIGIISSKKWLRRFHVGSYNYLQFSDHLVKLYKLYNFDKYYQGTLENKLKDSDSWDFIGGTMFIANISIAKYIYNHDIDSQYLMLNKLDSIDSNWIRVLKEIGKDPKDCGNDLEYRVKFGKSLYADHMIEHTFERFFCLISKMLNLKIYPV